MPPHFAALLRQGHDSHDHANHAGTAKDGEHPKMENEPPSDAPAPPASEADTSTPTGPSPGGLTSQQAGENTDPDHADHSMSDSEHAGHKPFFVTNKTGFYLLFKGALINNTAGFVAALFGAFLFAILTTIVFEVARRVEKRGLVARGGKSVPLKVVGAAANGFKMLMHYIAMLIVMTMNVWLIIAVVLGHAVGWLGYSFVYKYMSRGEKDASLDDIEAAKARNSTDAGGCPCT